MREIFCGVVEYLKVFLLFQLVKYVIVMALVLIVHRQPMGCICWYDLGWTLIILSEPQLHRIQYTTL